MGEFIRWSGYGTQSRAWQQGYDWGWDQGEHADLSICDAIEACGYDLSGADSDAFEQGAEFALTERGI